MLTNDEETCIRVCGNEAVRGFPEISHASLKSLGVLVLLHNNNNNNNNNNEQFVTIQQLSFSFGVLEILSRVTSARNCDIVKSST